MPLYEYQCSNPLCKFEDEDFRPIEERHEELLCSLCCIGLMKLQISAVRGWINDGMWRGSSAEAIADIERNKGRV